MVGILVGLFCFFFREPVLRIFIREANPEILAAVVQAGAIRLIIAGPTYFLCGLMDCTAATLRGTGVTTLVQGIAILVVRHKLIQKYGNIDCEAA